VISAESDQVEESLESRNLDRWDFVERQQGCQMVYF
jgi:hypothetical protein